MKAAFWSCSFASCVVLTLGCSKPASNPPQTTFSYEKQVGIASLQGSNGGCFAIFNDSLQPGTKVVLADQPPANEQYDKPAVWEASIVERVTEVCDNHLSASHDSEGEVSWYTLRTSAPEWKGTSVQVAIIDPKEALVVRDEKVTGDIDGDGTAEFFRNCFSNEGVHYQVWTGVPLEGRGRWHWYYYAGYDLEYNCSEKEYFGPKSR